MLLINTQSKTTFVVLAVAIAAVFIASAVLVTTEAKAKRKRRDLAQLILNAPIATSDNNVYITWRTNKTGNDEVMLRASTDNGVTFVFSSLNKTLFLLFIASLQ